MRKRQFEELIQELKKLRSEVALSNAERANWERFMGVSAELRAKVEENEALRGRLEAIEQVVRGSSER